MFFGVPAILIYYYYTKYKLEHIKEILVLIGNIAQSDGILSNIEEQYINHILFKRYGKRRQKKYIETIKSHINHKTNINESINQLNDTANGITKIQILHTLVKITTIDGYLTNSELSALSNITHLLQLKYFQLDSLLAMCNFTSEKAERQKKQKPNTRQSKISQALRILELSNTATNDDIKKSYKKLVLLYHPDKTLNLNKQQKELATEKFLKISDAYELLKSNKGFK